MDVPDKDAATLDAGAGSAPARRRRATGKRGGSDMSPRPSDVTAALTVHLLLRLTPCELDGLDAEADALGLTRSTCLSALVRRWILGRPTFSRPDELTLITIQMELRRLGVSLAQTVRVLGAVALEGRATDLELSRIEEIRREIRGQIALLRQALAGNLAYWRVDP